MRVVQNCAAGLEFDIVAGNCRDKEVANCNPCIANPSNELHFILDDNYCAKYIMCVGNSKFNLECAEGFHFNTEINACDIPANARCPNTPTPPTPPTPTTEHPTPPTHPGHVEADCDLDKNFEMIASLRTCDRYIVCACGHQNVQTCAPGLVFDIVNKRCGARAEGAVCLKDNSVNCPPNGVVEIAHPIDIRHYYLCMNGLPILRACPAGSTFNAQTNQCESICASNDFIRNGTQSALIQLSHNIDDSEEAASSWW